MLKVKHLQLQRGGKAVLHGIDLCIRPGEISALVGANGAGKSSTVMAIGGVLPISGGAILVDERPMHNQRPERIRAAGVAVVPEGHKVLGDLSVLDNLRVAAAALPAAAVAAQIDRVLSIFPELKQKLQLQAKSLSGGQKQMVCIAQALVVMPRYLVIDELSLGLSPMIVKRLADVVREVAAQGLGVLLIEQFTSLALAISTQAYVLERGRLAFNGSSAELQAKPEILHSSYLATTTA